MEIDNEKLLNLQRAFFDMVIRNCGMCHSDLVEFYENKRLASSNPDTYTPGESYSNLIKAVAGILVDAKNVPNESGQCGINTRFKDGVEDFLKNKQ